MILDYSVYYPFRNLICVVWQLSDRYNHNNDEFLVTDIKDLMNHLDLDSAELEKLEKIFAKVVPCSSILMVVMHIHHEEGALHH